MPALVKIMVVDDHPSLRLGLISMVESFEDQFKVVAEAGSVAEALLKVPTVLPDVVLTDLHFGNADPTGGIALIQTLNAEHPQIKTVLITASLEDEVLLLAHEAGANAFLGKEASAREIERAIDAVSSGFTHFPSRLRDALLERERQPRLTEREKQIIPLIASCKTNKQIAIVLTKLEPAKPIEERTVETHRSNLKRKFGLSSTTDLIPFCISFVKKMR